MRRLLHIADTTSPLLTLCGRSALRCALLTGDIAPGGCFVCANCSRRSVELRAAERSLADPQDAPDRCPGCGIGHRSLRPHTRLGKAGEFSVCDHQWHDQ